MKIYTALLHAAATFWDTRDHAILGCLLDSTSMITLPDLDMQIPHKLISFFDMPPDDIYSSLLPFGPMNLSFLITAYETKDKNNPAWIRTVSFYLYAQFLLIFSQGDADIRIISIIEQVETRANPIPIILAETIIGLNSFKEQNRLFFRFNYKKS